MHLSRRRNVLFFAEKTLRPGDGERWAYQAGRRSIARPCCEQLLLMIVATWEHSMGAQASHR